MFCMIAMETDCIFSDDLVEEILSRLSVRQLLRFRCVSKSLRAIVDNPRFINKHHERQHVILGEQGDLPLLLAKYPGADNSLEDDLLHEFFILSKRYGDVLLCVTPDLKRDSASQSPEIMKHFKAVQCVGCANGVVLLEWGLNSSFPYLGLWNPATREFKVVPPRSPLLSKEYHSGKSTMGFDPKSNDLKIIRLLFRITDEIRFYYSYDMCEMYSLNTNSWKSIEYPSHPELHLEVGPNGTGVYINSIHYWPYNNDHCKQVPEHEKSKCILSFDFCNEMFRVVSLPRMEVQLDWSLGNYNGSLAIIYSDDIQQLQTEIIRRLQIWVTTNGDDHGIPSSWKHLFTIELFRTNIVKFLSFRVGGDIIITLYGLHGFIHPVDGRDDDISCLYDPATKKITKIFGCRFFECFEYVESLFKLSKIV